MTMLSSSRRININGTTNNKKLKYLKKTNTHTEKCSISVKAQYLFLPLSFLLKASLKK